MKLDWITFWVSALACYRMTILITRDKIGKPLRNLWVLGTWFKCTYCISVWMGFGTTLILMLAGVFTDWWLAFLLSLSFSAITIFADRSFSADYQA